jgi:hypothetical protein
MDLLVSTNGEVEDWDFEEHLSRRSGWKVARTIWEEKSNKEIMLGSQETLLKMIGNNQRSPN